MVEWHGNEEFFIVIHSRKHLLITSPSPTLNSISLCRPLSLMLSTLQLLFNLCLFLFSSLQSSSISHLPSLPIIFTPPCQTPPLTLYMSPLSTLRLLISLTDFLYSSLHYISLSPRSCRRRSKCLPPTTSSSHGVIMT